ncbi:MAG TPA: hypothetical protein PLX89_10100 [Verrucomicrobiota bacterium]|nr:hypothetical protein [Verrucomicrobiales bacterium]HRI13348.1 hypothetical protein [Verrucomicrobiota bacterium]
MTSNQSFLRQGWFSFTLPALACLLAFASGCSTTPDAPSAGGGLSKEAILQHEDVKGKPPTPFAYPLDQVHAAALRSLVAVGCEVKKQEPYYVSGSRPRKFGLIIGSGGETVEVFMYPKSETETDVWVDTDTTFVGLAGQQGWNDQVLKEMTTLLAEPTTKP